MGKRCVDLSFLDDLHAGGYVFTVAYIFNFLKDEIKAGKTVQLENKQGSKKMTRSIGTPHELETFYIDNFKANHLDVFASNET